MCFLENLFFDRNCSFVISQGLLLCVLGLPCGLNCILLLMREFEMMGMGEDVIMSFFFCVEGFEYLVLLVR